MACAVTISFILGEILIGRISYIFNFLFIFRFFSEEQYKYLSGVITKRREYRKINSNLVYGLRFEKVPELFISPIFFKFLFIFGIFSEG